MLSQPCRGKGKGISIPNRRTSRSKRLGGMGGCAMAEMPVGNWSVGLGGRAVPGPTRKASGFHAGVARLLKALCRARWTTEAEIRSN